MNRFDFITDVNWLAVVVVTILSFMLGALWHNDMLFGKAWKQDAEPQINKDDKSAMMRLFGLSALLHFIAAVGLASFVGSESTWLIGMMKGLFISIFWVVTSIGVTYQFAGKTIRLFFIDAGFYVVFFAIAGAIFGAW